MEGIDESESGSDAQEALAALPPDLRASWEARLARVAAARQHAQQKPSGPSRPRLSPDGDWRANRILRLGHVPPVYLDGKWELVRSPAIWQWCQHIDRRIPMKAERDDPVDWNALGHGLFIFGPVGTGKSTSAALVCKAAARLDRTVRWSYVPDLVDELAANARQRDAEIGRQAGVDLLVWDDLGVRDFADWEISYLDQIVESRYRRRLPMVVTTNWTPQDLAADERMARMVDRWRERVASQSAVLAGQSMREKGGAG